MTPMRLRYRNHRISFEQREYICALPSGLKLLMPTILDTHSRMYFHMGVKYLLPTKRKSDECVCVSGVRAVCAIISSKNMPIKQLWVLCGRSNKNIQKDLYVKLKALMSVCRSYSIHVIEFHYYMAIFKLGLLTSHQHTFLCSPIQLVIV